MEDASNLFEYAGCSTALARTENPQTSKDAAKKMVESGALSRQEKWVYEEIIRYSRLSEDFTTKDIAGWTYAVAYHKAYDICRRRFSGLERKNKIHRICLGVNSKTGKNIYRQRNGCCVYCLR